MRFIINFFFYGILFYAIYLLFPDTFHTLVSWADHVWVFLKELVNSVSGKAQQYLPSEAPKSLYLQFFL